MITLTTYKWIPDFAQPLMRGMRVRWALEEAGLPYNVRKITHGVDQRTPEHLARQPFGQCPAIEEDGLVMFESGAIVLYIAEKSEALMPKDRIGRNRATQWVFAALNSVETWVQQLAGLDLFHANDAWAKERRPQLEIMVKGRLELLANALGDKDHLEGRFTVGDLMMADVLRLLAHTNLLDAHPNLKAYQARCLARPAFRKALADQMAGYEKAA